MSFSKQTITYFILSILITVGIFSCSRQDAGKIKIGVLLPLSGDIAVYGISAKNGIEIAMDEEMGLIKENNISVTFDDEKGEPKSAVNAATKMISVDNCDVLLEGGSSSCVLAIAPIAEHNKKILLATFASSPEITNAGDYIFRIMPSDVFQASLLPEWLNEYHLKRVAVIYQKNDWGVALRDKFKEIMIAAGAEITFDEGIDTQQKDFRGVVNKLKMQAAGSDAIFMPVYPVEAGNLLKQLYENKVALPIFGGDMCANQQLIDVAGVASNGVKFFAPMPYYGEEYKAFASAFKKKFNAEPDLPACAGYDAMKSVISCIKILQNDKKDVTSENIKAYLYNKVDFTGATGRVKFDSKGDPVFKIFKRRTISNGTIVELK